MNTTHSRTPPENPVEGDWWIHEIAGVKIVRQYIDGKWVLIEGGSPAPPEPTKDPLDD